MVLEARAVSRATPMYKVRDTVPVTHYLTPLISACFKNSTTIKHIHNSSANIIEGCYVAFDTTDC